MIVIVGESGSGKTSIVNELSKNYVNYNKIITYTTRPMRVGEVDGVDYNFVSNSKFKEMIKNNEFVEHAIYRDWYYGTAKKDCTGEGKIIILTPHGLRNIKKENFDIQSFYINVSRKERLIRLLERGDNIDEAYRRNLTDVGQFDGIEDEVDYIIDNYNGYRSVYELCNEINKIIIKYEIEKVYKK